MNPSNAPCPAVETLAAYLDRRLDPAERDRVEAHLAACAACRDEALDLARLAAAVAASDLGPSPRLRAAVMARLHSRKPSTARSARRRNWGFAVISAAAAAALVAVGLALWMGRPAPRPDEAPRVTTAPPRRPAPAPAPEEAPPRPPPPAPAPEKPDAPKPPPEPPKAAPPAPEPAPKPPDLPRAETPEKPKPEPEPAPPPAPRPPEPPKTEPTRAVLATVQRVEGPVFLLQGHERRPAAASTELLPGQGLLTGPAAGAAVVRYPDGTVLELGPETRVARLFEEDGKRLELAQGTLRASVARQPAGRPFAVLTPHGEARVVGTTFRITVRTGDRPLTRVEVTEGKVQLKGTAGKPVEVPAGHHATTSPSAEAAARPVTSLLAHWKLDEAAGRVAADASGNGHDAVLAERADWAAGRIGGGLSCAKGGFTLPALDGGYPGNAVTIALWVYQDNLHGWQDGYVHFWGLSMVREGNMDPGRIRVTWKTEGENENLAADALVRSKQWVHLAVSWDGTTARLYRNGRPAATSKVKGPFQPSAGAILRVGADPNAKYDFELRVDDLQVYRRALTAPEVQQVMAGVPVR
jgi:ferric-dicitrate binding protein FerR (iron transport regulator)